MAAAKFTVLVTRPKPQSAQLCAMIEARGWRPIALPTIEIRHCRIDAPPDLAAFDALIFVSRNAVEAALEHWTSADLNRKQLIAIGTTTARLLESYGAVAVESVSGQANSERLLQIAALQAEQLTGKSVLILSGQGGRELLAQALLQRGARVKTLALYQRLRPCYDADEIARCWQQRPDVIVITSNESADNLAAIMQATDYYSSMLATPTVVMSPRVHRHIAGLGFQRQGVVAPATSNEGLIAAIGQCFDEVKRE